MLQNSCYHSQVSMKENKERYYIAITYVRYDDIFG